MLHLKWPCGAFSVHFVFKHFGMEWNCIHSSFDRVRFCVDQSIKIITRIIYLESVAGFYWKFYSRHKPMETECIFLLLSSYIHTYIYISLSIFRCLQFNAFKISTNGQFILILVFFEWHGFVELQSLMHSHTVACSCLQFLMWIFEFYWSIH